MALLIGNANYTVGRLTNPPSDVREIESALKAAGFSDVVSFQAAMAILLCCCTASYAYFLWVKADNSPQ